jgi:hypothetical protein
MENLKRRCPASKSIAEPNWPARRRRFRERRTIPHVHRFSFLETLGGMATKESTFTNGLPLARVIQVFTCVALLSVCSCASTNYKKADAASESLQKAGRQIQAESYTIDLTLAALDDLVNKPAADLKPQFERFNASLDRLVAASNRAQKAADTAHKKSADYFENWDKQTADIKFDAVRDQSVSRKTQVSNEFSTLDQRYSENQAVMEPLISYLQDIRTALSTDLTAGGIQSVKPLADNAQQNARKVQAALARLSNELTASGARMSSVIPRDSQAKGGAGEATETGQERAQSTPVNP